MTNKLHLKESTKFHAFVGLMCPVCCCKISVGPVGTVKSLGAVDLVGPIGCYKNSVGLMGPMSLVGAVDPVGC